MKRFICVFLCVFILTLVVCPCFADYIPWFGSGESYYLVDHLPGYNFLHNFIRKNDGFIPVSDLVAYSSTGGIESQPNVAFIKLRETTSYFYLQRFDSNKELISGEYTLPGTYSWFFKTPSDMVFDPSISSYFTLVSNPGGFLDESFSNTSGFFVGVLDFMFDNSSILLAIGFSVAVTLIGWGISKIKNLVSGY